MDNAQKRLDDKLDAIRHPGPVEWSESGGGAEHAPMTTDEAREYLVKFMEQHFTDKTFHRYIRGQIGGSGPLAGDFAWQMARALRMLGAPASADNPSTAGADEPNAVSMLSGALNHARDALRFYAGKEHFHMHQPDEWDTVSGEPQNFYEDSNNTATVEDGSVAKRALEDVAHVERYASLAAPVAQSTAGAAKGGIDLSNQLLEYADNPGYSHNDYADTMRMAADEIDRLTGLLAAPAAQAPTPVQWISVEDQLPQIPSDVPSYATYVNVIAFAGNRVRQMKWAVNAYAKTEKGRAPRWEEKDGRLAFDTPTHWMPLPAAPEQSALGEKGGDHHA